MTDIQHLLTRCHAKGLQIATAESCTGGMIAAAITDIPGASDVFDRGFITYSNPSKTGMLGVEPSLIDEVGAVSDEVACAMAEGALHHSGADVAVSVTGIAGPGGGTEAKPVGTVHIAVAARGTGAYPQRYLFEGNRDAIRQQTVDAALALLLEMVERV